MEMSKHQRFILAVAVVAASFVPATSAMAGVMLPNHNETLLRDV
jgi:hypothetical protein